MPEIRLIFFKLAHNGIAMYNVTYQKKSALADFS